VAYNNQDSNYGSYYADYSLMGKEETINIAQLLRLLLKRWYVFVIAVPIFVGLGVLYLMKTPKTYKTGASLMIEQGGPSLGRGQTFSEGISFIPLTDNIVDEIAYLRSYSLINQVVERLNFEVKYFEKSGLKEIEHFEDPTFPFTVNIDYSHPQMSNVQYFVEILNESQYSISIEGTESFPLFTKGITPEENEIATIQLGETFEFEETGTFGQALENQYFRFTLEKVERGKIKDGSDYGFTFIPNPFWASYYQSAVEVSKVPEGRVVLINAEGPVPAKDIKYLNALGQTYIDTRLAQKNAFADGTIDFITTQLNSVKGQVDSTREEFIKTTREQATAVLGGTGSSMSARLQEAERNKTEILKHINYLETNLEAVKGGGELVYLDPMTIGLNAPNIFQTIGKLSDLKQELIELKVTGGDLEKKVKESQIEETQKSLRGMLAGLLSSKQLELRSVNRTIGKLQSEIKSAPGAQSAISTAQRTLELNESLLDYLRQSLAAAQISKAGTKPDSYFLDKARMKSSGPVSPKPFVILAAAFTLGMALPAAIIILLSFFNDKIRDEEHLKSLTDIPVLASIVHEEEPDSIQSPDFILSPLAEAFRYLNINVDYVLNPQNNEKVVGVTSIVKGEGKTFNSVHLGAVMAMSGKRTIIVGADIRRPQLYHRLGLDNEVGLTNYLLGRTALDEVVKETKIQNLYAITSGNRPPNLVELLNSPSLPNLVEELKANFDYVIIDTPPVGLVSDYLILAPLMDINLIVTRERYSKIDFIKEVNNMRVTEKLSRLYFVLNDVRANKAGYGKGKYGSRYEYGYGESKKNKKKSKSKKNKISVS